MSALQADTTGNSGVEAPEFPALHIANRLVSATVCLPDTENGYYRGTRFDWSGVVRSLYTREHRYVAQWQAQHDPLRHDGLTGPADEFSQIGYEQAQPGQEFLKIGVGTLRKPDNQPYDRFRLYEIVDSGIRNVIAGTDRIEFRHRLQSGNYAYDYRKTLRLTDARGLRIGYMVRNLGPGPFTGEVYNHNFFTLDNMITSTDTSIRLPFRPKGTWREPYDSVSLTPDGIAFSRNLREGEKVFMGDLRSQDLANQEYGFSLRNLDTGAGIQVSGSGPLSHFVFWACPAVACLEPYIPFQILPGETYTWHIDYRLLE
ncbi:hypothetical protein [uncultured Alistipes sp.]|jgi:hypothetical protein|uniref:hypothetical protein n=1 Tax=uncultured Alistipes sp. TaxID=538949 RepID=UPI0025FCB805|nr:hypothetical protein [uncultured Alistipes sp.]